MKAQSGRKGNFNHSTAEVLHSSASFKPQYDLKCVFCNNSHTGENCKTVTNVSSRKNILREKNRCFSCLNPGYISGNCYSKISCFECSGKHHVSKCFKKFPSHVDDKKGGHSTPSGPEVPALPSQILIKFCQYVVKHVS